MTKKDIEDLVTIEDCTVIVNETATSKIVETSVGKKVNVETPLPDVRKGHKGILIEIDGKTTFVREPYGGDIDDFV